MNMLIKFLMIVILFSFTSCMALKQKQMTELSLLKAYQEQLNTLSKSIQNLESTLWEQGFEAQSETISWRSDSLFRWHPDSGLYLQPANLQIEITQRKHIENTKATKQAASSSEVQSLAKWQATRWEEEHLQKDVQRLKKISYYWVFAIPGVLLLLLLVRRLRVF